MKKKVAYLLAAFAMMIAFAIFAARPVSAADGFLDVSKVTTSSVTLRWNKTAFKAEGEKVQTLGYKLYYGTSTEKMKQFGEKLSAKATGKTVTGLKARKRYFFRLKVILKHTNLETGKSKTVLKDYVDNPLAIYTLPEKIDTIRTTSSAVKAKKLRFKWKDVNPSDNSFGYEYEVKTRSGNMKDNGSTTENGVVLKNASNATYYLGRVRSTYTFENRDGKKTCYGEWSNWAALLSTPVVIGASLSGGKINVTWTEMKGVDGYDIYITNDNWKGYYKAGYTSTGATSGTIETVKGKKFSYKRGESYEVSIVARKKIDGKNYYSPGDNDVTIYTT